MADATYGPKVYHAQGGDQVVVASGGSIKVETGGQIVPNSGTQPSTIADLSITTDLTGVDTGTDMTAAQAAQIEADLAAIATKLNAALAALEGAGIVAAS